MSRLKALFDQLEFDRVETFIASGNVLFSSGEKNSGRLEARIAQHLQTSLGYEVDTFVRTDREVASIGGKKQFKEDGNAGVGVYVSLLHKELPRDVARKLEAVSTDVDEFRVAGREYYWLCRVRITESTVWTLPEVKALSLPTSSTMRNLTSIRKLIAKHII
jgi:uncharacterized protein (DUF1697 family)